MQELVSFISIMLGVIILTAWVMWILFRPSGDVKAKEFARESARDGLTRAVMENNELKNKVTRLERELKVLMSAGYGKTKEAKEQEEREEVEGERLKIKDERLEINEEIQEKEEEVVAANSFAQEEKTEEKKSEQLAAAEPTAEQAPATEKETSPDADSPAAPEPVTKTQAAADADTFVRPEPTTEKEPDVDEKSFSHSEPKTDKDAIVGANSFAQQNTQQEAAQPELELASEPETEAEPEPQPDLTQKAVADDELHAKQPAFHKIIDEAEKKKIAEYLANVAKTTERQKKEVEAIAKWKESAPDADDDLKLIRGIGLHLEKKLKRAGITSYAQIANFDEDDIRRISDVIGSYPRRIKREEWVEQARKLLDQA